MTTKLETWKQLSQRIPLKRTQVWRLIKRGKFPAPIKIGERRSAWRSDTIDLWIAEREAAQKDKCNHQRTESSGPG